MQTEFLSIEEIVNPPVESIQRCSNIEFYLMSGSQALGHRVMREITLPFTTFHAEKLVR